MNVTRRTALGVMTGAAALAAMDDTGAQPLTVAPGPFAGTKESLATYQIPDWFRNAKFGIWAHWGPQSAIEDGDWYARKMYIQGDPQYNYHVATYGHPSKFGYKDTIPNWKAAEWDPDHLMGLYKNAGAKYFFSMGVHHDNFDLWNSKYQRWNSVQMGPKKDVVGLWKQAATNHGLKFGVSEHLWITYKWFTTSHGHDATGPLAGVPYDGANSEFADLYTNDKTVYLKQLPWNENGIPDEWRQHWHNRILDLVENYQPDLLYTDGPLPFEKYGWNILANLYNLSAQKNGGNNQAVYFSKKNEDCEVGTCALDVERGVVDNIRAQPWQTDTCIGEWHYKRGITYKRPKQVIDLLADIVSRNGNLLLNFPLPNSGKLDDKEMAVLSGITDWMAINNEGIYDTRPYKVFGNPPATATTGKSAMFNEQKRHDMTAADVRFTTKGQTLYAFVMGDPGTRATIPLLGSESEPAKIENVSMLGLDAKLQWSQTPAALTIDLPETKPSQHAVCFKVDGALKA